MCRYLPKVPYGSYAPAYITYEKSVNPYFPILLFCWLILLSFARFQFSGRVI
jgi:hypothetical protein